MWWSNDAVRSGFDQAHQIIYKLESVELGVLGLGESLFSVLIQKFTKPALSMVGYLVSDNLIRRLEYRFRPKN